MDTIGAVISALHRAVFGTVFRYPVALVLIFFLISAPFALVQVSGISSAMDHVCADEPAAEMAADHSCCEVEVPIDAAPMPLGGGCEGANKDGCEGRCADCTHCQAIVSGIQVYLSEAFSFAMYSGKLVRVFVSHDRLCSGVGIVIERPPIV